VATRSGGPRNTLAFASLLKKKLNSLSRSAIFSTAVGGLQPEGSLGCSVFSSVQSHKPLVATTQRCCER
jgi:hypothetical protein